MKFETDSGSYICTPGWKRESPPFTEKTLCTVTVVEEEREGDTPDWAKEPPYEAVVPEERLEPER